MLRSPLHFFPQQEVLSSLEVPQQSPVFSQIPVQRVARVDGLEHVVARRAPRKAHCDQREEVFESVPKVRIHIATTRFDSNSLLSVVKTPKTLNETDERGEKRRPKVEKLLERRRER